MHGIVDEKTDVFAFGVFLLEVISGRKPVDGSHQSLHSWVGLSQLFVMRFMRKLNIEILKWLVTLKKTMDPMNRDCIFLLSKL